MITAASIPYISQVLKEPQKITEADADSISEMTESFPYFVAARYLDAAYRHKQTPYNESMMADMRLYTGNWLLYSEFLQKANDGAMPEMEAPTPAPTAAQQPGAVEDKGAKDTTGKAETSAPKEEPATIKDNDDFQPTNTGFVTGDNNNVTAKHQEEVEENIDKVEEKVITEEATPEPEPAVVTPQPELQVTDTTEEDKPELKSRIESETDETLILPVYTEDYFMHQGVNVSNRLPEDMDPSTPPIIENEEGADDKEKALMVVMSFSEWLNFFKKRKMQAEEEEEGQRALKTMWQKEKLAAALEEEDDEIPENVFEMAVNSISKEDEPISESLANVHIKQGRYDKAIDMYRKLSLRNPQKKAYFVRKIEVLLKERNS